MKAKILLLLLALLFILVLPQPPEPRQLPDPEDGLVTFIPNKRVTLVGVPTDTITSDRELFITVTSFCAKGDPAKDECVDGKPVRRP